MSLRRKRIAERRDQLAVGLAVVFRRHFESQARSTSPLTDKRWNEELSAALLDASREAVKREGTTVARGLGGRFDLDQVENYLRARAQGVAEAVNVVTAEEDDTAKGEKAEEILDAALAARADQLGLSNATALASFAAMEAGKQNQDERAPRAKQWIGSGLPDSRHSGVANEIVGLYEAFSNGAQFPGDISLGVDQTAGCRCSLDVL